MGEMRGDEGRNKAPGQIVQTHYASRVGKKVNKSMSMNMNMEKIADTAAKESQTVNISTEREMK